MKKSNIAGVTIKNGHITGALELVRCVNNYKTPGEEHALYRAQQSEKQLALSIQLIERLQKEISRRIVDQAKLTKQHNDLAAASRSYLAAACNDTRAHLSFLLAKES